jgi:hypothetical protein
MPGESIPQVAIPPMIADLAYELWQRATAAAAVELKGGPTARQVIARTEEAQALRAQLAALRDQLQRDALSYGELRAQSARHEAIAAAALEVSRDAEKRERIVLRDLGAANQRIAALEAAIAQRDATLASAPKLKRSTAKRSATTPPARKPTRRGKRLKPSRRAPQRSRRPSKRRR